MMRGLCALLLAILLHLASCVSDAQDLEGCYPVEPGSLALVSDRLSLGSDQTRWLMTRFKAGKLRRPEDLDEMPGVGSDLRDVLTAAFCWSPFWEGSLDLSSRTRPEGSRNEARTRLERGPVAGAGRVRWDSLGDLFWRGDLAHRHGSWLVRGGSLHARRGLGLLLATPGAEPRSFSPLRMASTGWRGSQSLDPDVVKGASLAWRGSRTFVEAAAVHGPVVTPDGKPPGWWGSLETGVRKRQFALGLLQVVSRQGWSVSGTMEAFFASGSWAAEWAVSGKGTAQGITCNMASGRWRFRASGFRIGRGYHVPSVRMYRRFPSSETVTVQIEGRWQGEPTRFVRMGIAEAREPGPWLKLENRIEVEVGQSILRGLRLDLLWRRRTRSEVGPGLDMPGDTERTLQGEWTLRRSPWRTQLRLERRRFGESGESLVTSLRLGRDARPAWEVRVAQIGLRGSAPGVWWYSRRAGGLYGWDRLGTGTWMGVWVRFPVGRWAFETSADARGDRWDLTGAIRVGVG